MLARVIADRQGRMSFAVSDCFAKYGVREHPLGWQVEGKYSPIRYPSCSGYWTRTAMWPGGRFTAIFTGRT